MQIGGVRLHPLAASRAGDVAQRWDRAHARLATAGSIRYTHAMAKTGFKSVDDYIASQPEAVQGVLEQVRSIIRKALPGTEELISYQIPVYKLDGRAVIYFAGWKQHYSLYPVGEQLVATFKDELAPYELSKGTIRFPLSERVPVRLIERIAKLRATEAEGATSKPKPKPRARAAASARRATSTSRRPKPRR